MAVIKFHYGYTEIPIRNYKCRELMDDLVVALKENKQIDNLYNYIDEEYISFFKETFNKVRKLPFTNYPLKIWVDLGGDYGCIDDIDYISIKVISQEAFDEKKCWYEICRFCNE